MKKNIIALAIASAVAAPVAMADAPVVYGQINIAVDSIKDNGMKTSDRDSRLGIKGSEDLGNGLKAVYKMEFGAKVGDAITTGLSGRNAYVGLAGGFGTVLLGRHDSPLKMSQASDLFGDSTYADMGKKYVTGSLGWDGKSGETRFDNVIAYVSPTFSGVKLVAAGVSGENAIAAPNEDKRSLANAYSIAAMYGSTKKGLYLSAAYNSADKYLYGGKGFDEMRVSAQYATGGLVANVVYQDFSDNDSSTQAANEGSNVQAQLGYKMGKFMPKVKIAQTDFKAAADKDGTAYGLGLDYALGKKTTAYVEYVNSDKKMLRATDSSDALSVGMVHKF